jgi:hypothetical protein
MARRPHVAWPATATVSAGGELNVESRFSARSQQGASILHSMATSAEPRDRANPPQLCTKEFWGLWCTRVTVILGVLATVVVVAVFGDPEHESWHAKTWELVCDLIARSPPVEDRCC